MHHNFEQVLQKRWCDMLFAPVIYVYAQLSTVVFFLIILLISSSRRCSLLRVFRWNANVEYREMWNKWQYWVIARVLLVLSHELQPIVVNNHSVPGSAKFY